MSRANHGLYQRGVQAYLEGQTALLLRIRRDPKLAPGERSLLEARSLFRESEFAKARKLLESFSGTGFLKAERLFLLATALNQVGSYEQAARTGLEALAIYESLDDRLGQFRMLYNLSVDYGRLGLLELSAYYVKRAEEKSEGATEAALLLRASACQHSKLGRFAEACIDLSRALELRGELNEVDRGVLDTVCADIFFRAGKWKLALEACEHLRSRRSNREFSRIEFEFQLIRALLGQDSLSTPGAAIAGSADLSLKWDLLLAVQSGQMDLSLRCWAELRKANPGTFGEAFELKSDSDRKSAFGVFLAKELLKLYHVLRESKIPLRKEELIEQVWDVPYDPKLDSRLYKLVQRLREQGQVPVHSQNRAYRL